MSALVLDTNIVSYLMRGSPREERYREHLEGNTLALSFMSVAELYEGAFRRGWTGRRMEALEETLKSYLVVPYSAAMCRSWGRIRAERRHKPISTDDAWIAATAITHDCPLVTHNPGDFEEIAGLSVITEADS